MENFRTMVAMESFDNTSLFVLGFATDRGSGSAERGSEVANSGNENRLMANPDPRACRILETGQVFWYNLKLREKLQRAQCNFLTTRLRHCRVFTVFMCAYVVI